ncbi:MAG: hypothetical protein AAF602_08630 [Myxococcota bacterium]
MQPFAQRPVVGVLEQGFVVSTRPVPLQQIEARLDLLVREAEVLAEWCRAPLRGALATYGDVAITEAGICLCREGFDYTVRAGARGAGAWWVRVAMVPYVPDLVDVLCQDGVRGPLLAVLHDHDGEVTRHEVVARAELYREDRLDRVLQDIADLTAALSA